MNDLGSNQAIESERLETAETLVQTFVFPASYAQQRLWLSDQLEPGTHLFNLHLNLRLQGQLDVPALEQSLNEVIRRHEVLRTTFSAYDGKPMQVIASALTLALPVVPLIGEFDQDTEIQQSISEEARRPFDLACGPLLRATLLRVSEADHVLLVTIHHIITDGWSMNIFMQELGVLYDAYAGGRHSPLPELPIQYVDFAQWQQEWLQSETLNAQLSYWKHQLEGNLPVLQLPTSHPRPSTQTYRGASYSQLLPATLFRSIKDLSKREGVTLFMTLLAAFQALLHRYANQDDMIIGTPIANRNRAEIEGLIGFFVNILVLRTDVSGSPTFLELLGRVREVCLAAYSNQDLPFERLVQELQPERSLSNSALFQVMFAMQTAAGEQAELPQLKIHRLSRESDTAKFDLTLTAVEREEELHLYWNYNTDLFEARTIERLSGHFERIVEAIVSDPEQRVSELAMLSEAERQELLWEWNETGGEYEREACIQELFEAQVEKTPQAIAIATAGGQLSYEELNRRANQLGHYLRRLGVGPEVLVAICAERGLEMVVGMMGILKAGGVFVPLDADYPKERLAYMLADARVEVLISLRELAGALPEHEARTVYLDGDWETIGQESEMNLNSGTRAANLAYMIYTSGTTGRPKGVQVPHGGLVNLVAWHQDVYGVSESDRASQLATPAFDAYIWEVWPYLTAGASVHVAERETSMNVGELLGWLAAEKITYCFLTTALAEAVLAAEWPAGLRLKALLTGGDKLHQQSAGGALPFSLVNHYGPTETTCVVTWGKVVETARDPSIGRPILNTQIFLLSPELQPVPVGAAGELYIGGAGVARGYLNHPELTAEKFIPNPYSAEGGARLYRSGDIARYLANGEIEFVGRADGQVKVRGFRIELSEIEHRLCQHPGIREAIVVARDDIGGDRRLAAYVVLKETPVAALTGREIRSYLAEKLPGYMVPAAFVLLETLPLTPNGKVDRRALPAPNWVSPELQATFIAARNPIEEVLAGVWSQVLQVETVGIHDSFFEIGGHSLLATQVISQIREIFQVELPLRALFEAPTVARLSERVEVAIKAGHGLLLPPLKRVSREEALPLSFAQQRLWFIDQLEPDSAAYNMPLAMRLSGELNVGALEESLSEIMRRHESLRTCFPIRDGEPVQLIKEAEPLKMPLRDLRELGAAEREARAQELGQAEAREPFVLAEGPLLRAQLLRLGEQEHIALVTMHHIVSDGWSMGVLVKEVATLYEAYSRGEQSPLAELGMQYADFSVWQRGWLSGELLARQLGYWREQLRGAAVLELPTDRVRPAVQSFRGATQSLRVGPAVTAGLKELSRREGVTLFMTLLAAFQTLLYRLSGQEDIVVGTGIANRNRGEVEGLIGFFVNTLALRTDLSGNPSFRELLGRVREVTLGAYAHQDVPFEKLVEELELERHLGHTPLFEVMFSLQNTPTEKLKLSGLKLQPLKTTAGTSHLGLILTMVEFPKELAATVEYSTELFDDATITRFSNHLRALLEGVVAHPERHLIDLPLLLGDENSGLRELSAAVSSGDQEEQFSFQQ